MSIRQGIDIVQVSRIENLIAKQGQKFISKVFTPGEVRYCKSRKNSSQHFAARFAAKEAVMKVLNLSKKTPCSFTEIEIKRLGNGAPSVVLKPTLVKRLHFPNKYILKVSLSHEKDFAVASAVLQIPAE